MYFMHTLPFIMFSIVKHCQVMWESEVCELAHFLFYFQYKVTFVSQMQINDAYVYSSSKW